MSGYSIFGKFYDLLQADLDYTKIARKYDMLLKKASIPVHLVADIGCGTGSLSIKLAQLGYEVIAVDSSIEMLEIAKSKDINNEILFINQNIEKLDLYGSIDACTASLDVINHIVNPKKLQKCFDRISLFLNKGGAFAFDFNTPKKFTSIYANNCFVYDYEDIFCTWENFLNAKTRLCKFYLTFFETENGVINRYDEEVTERMYEIDEIKQMLKLAGFYKIKITYTENQNRAIVLAIKQ